MGKPCIKCGVIKEITSFYKHHAMADGTFNKCKECAKADARMHRMDNIERYKEHDRARANLPHRAEAREQYRKTADGKAAAAMAHEKYRKRWPEKYKANNAVNSAIRSGVIYRRPCEVCGSTENIHAHHHDYSRPLDVNWLCQRHHLELHNRIRESCR